MEGMTVAIGVSVGTAQLGGGNGGDEDSEDSGMSSIARRQDPDGNPANIHSIDQLVIAFLPRQSTRSGWVTFTTDPATVDQIEPHVLGYQEP